MALKAGTVWLNHCRGTNDVLVMSRGEEGVRAGERRSEMSCSAAASRREGPPLELIFSNMQPICE